MCPKCGSRYPGAFKVCPHDAAPLVDAPDTGGDPLIGTTLGEAYEIVRRIGEGGMGRVYEAKHTRLRNKRFAIKILLDEFSRQPEVVARFQREAESASGIAHPNVMGVYDVHRTADGRPYIVGEFLEGEEFGAFLDRVRKIDAPTAVAVVRQVCRALQAAHARGIVHRDMKPENVFLVGDRSAPLVKVLDFGISKQQDGGAGLTRTGMVIGTPSYMAPEQARGAKVDHRADVYAVGGILYRALTGHRPFEGEDAAAVLTAVLTEEPKRPRAQESTIPENLELVIQRAMAKEAQDRYQTMADLDAALAEFDTLSPMNAAATLLATVPAGGGTVSAHDKTVIAVANVPTTEKTQIASQEARHARPMLVLFTVCGYAWLAAGLISAVADVLRYGRPPVGTLTYSESVLISLGIGVATMTPLGLWVRHLRRGVWGNTLRSVQLARRVRRAVVAAIAAYGVGMLTLHFFEGVVQRLPLSGGQTSLSGVVFAIGLLFGWLAWSREGAKRGVG
jgi:serine/threonine-protein kinase